MLDSFIVRKINPVVGGDGSGTLSHDLFPVPGMCWVSRQAVSVASFHRLVRLLQLSLGDLGVTGVAETSEVGRVKCSTSLINGEDVVDVDGRDGLTATATEFTEGLAMELQIPRPAMPYPTTPDRFIVESGHFIQCLQQHQP